MAEAIRVDIIHGITNSPVLTMVVRENFDIYRGTQDTIIHAIARNLGIEVDKSTYDMMAEAVYDVRMNDEVTFFLQDHAGNEHHITLKRGYEKDLFQ